MNIFTTLLDLLNSVLFGGVSAVAWQATAVEVLALVLSFVTVLVPFIVVAFVIWVLFGNSRYR